jgi:chromate reductase, NAD(P)H dehydrogenase (quinone)
MVDILAISGSLRRQSGNTELLRALALLAPLPVAITLYDGLATLPHFNPDLDQEGMELPVTVRELRDRVGQADAIVICSPEYAHGVPGVLKNALDWLVSAPELVFMPIGLLNAAPRATYAHEQLAETLRTMSTTVVPGASIAIPVSGRGLDAAGIVADESLASDLRGALEALVAATRERRPRI